MARTMQPVNHGRAARTDVSDASGPPTHEAPVSTQGRGRNGVRGSRTAPQPLAGAFARIPKAGEFRSNLSLGAGFVRCEITQKEKRLVREISPAFLKEGLFFVGIDVRRGLLIEVNVTSPAGLVELDQLYGGATEKLVRSIQRA